jgi:diguanylate cyclase (GGDEF)-like protein/PAS domain S-box-containing protein
MNKGVFSMKKGSVTMRQWMLIFVLLIITVLINELGTTLFPTIKMYKYASVVTFLVAMVLIFVLFKKTEQTAKELHNLEQREKNVFDTLDVAIWSHNLKTNTLLITPGIEKLYGYSSEEFYRDFDLWKKVIHPEDLDILYEREQKIKLGEAATSEYRIIRPDGEVRWIQDSGYPTIDEYGNFVDFNSVLFDITNRKESENRYRSLVEMSPDFVAVVSRGRIDYINEAGSRLLGASKPCELTGLSAKQFTPEEVIEEIQRKEMATLGGKSEPIRLEFQLKRLDGLSVEVEMSAMPILLGGRIATQVVGRDITERKKAEMTIQHMAFYDTLTGIPNRNMFKKHLNEVLNFNRKEKVAVLFLDLDRFKSINDTKGHSTGDLLLQKVAKRLQNAVQTEGMVSRQGGDEFIILIENTNNDQAIEVTLRILTEFSSPFELNGEEYFVTSSIGISIYPTDGMDQETLIKNAGTAMYVAKGRGKNKFQFYSANFNGNSNHKMELENGLRKALEQNQLSLYYQPQIELTTGQVVGFEALLRWEHPKFGMISPDEFIPLAEETGLIVPIGKWVLKTACEQNKAWQKAGLTAVTVAVNISVCQFQDENFVDFVINALDDTELDPEYLELEITESVMQDLEKSKHLLNELKKLGVSLAIDDFGTGYSSLSYLRHLPIDKIKIDKSFVDDILYHSNQGLMVKTIIDMGNHLQFSVIAEGIELKEQLDFLEQNECKIGQGYYFSQPLPAEQIEDFLKRMSIVEVL